MKSRQSKTGSVVAVGCSALLGGELMCHSIANVVGENQSNVVARGNPLADNSPVAGYRTGIGLTNCCNNRGNVLSLERAKLLKSVLERCSWRTHDCLRDGIKHESTNEREQQHRYEIVIHKNRTRN